jgi:hypothetical protein
MSRITGMNPKASFGNRFRSKLRGVKPLLMRDNSTCNLQCTLFLKRGFHYPPLRGIVQLTNSAASQMTFRLLRFPNWSFNNKFRTKLRTRL